MPVDCARALPLGNVARETWFGAKPKFDKMPPMNEISDFDAGFICGLVTGEGSFTLRSQATRTRNQASSR